MFNMIQKIKKLKQFGIFQNFASSTDLHDFVKFNLIYGWNGSGKTTLSRLFSALLTKKLPESFSSAEFEIQLDNGAPIKQNSLASFNEPVFVFNQQFIEDNIDWRKQGAKSIIVIAEDKIEERKRFFEIRDKLLPIKQVSKEGNITLFNASEKERDNFLTDLARSLKQSFQLIDTSDRRYLNYDRTKLKDFIKENDQDVRKDESIFDTAALEKLRQQAKPVEKPPVTYTLPQLSAEQLGEAETKIKELLGNTVVNQSIARLQEYTEINSWVQIGLKLHDHLQSKNCEFCGQSLPEKRIEELRQHFSLAYQELMDRLAKASQWLEGFKLGYTFPEFGELYEELQTDYKKALEGFRENEVRFINAIDEWKTALQEKLSNPFEASASPKIEIVGLVTALSADAQKIERLAKLHNNKTTNFKAELDKVKKALELHYVSQALKEKKYFDLVARIEKEKKEMDAAGKVVEDLESELKRLEASLANVS